MLFDVKRRNVISGIESGAYRVKGKDNQSYVIEWEKLAALSEQFADRMASLAHLGIESFKQIEIDFLSARPGAVEEDKNLAVFKGLDASHLNEQMENRLSHIFHMRPKDLSPEMSSFMKNVFYYVVTIKEENSFETKGFVTLMGGGSLPDQAYKITVLAVDPAARKIGLASLLINFLDRVGIEYRKILASTRPTNAVALNSFAKWGFVEDQKISYASHFVHGHWVHLVKEKS